MYAPVDDQAGHTAAGMHSASGSLGRRERRLNQPLLDAAVITPGDHVLDIGCGAGATALLAARAAAPHGSALGLDLSGPMLQRARAGAESADLANVRFEQGDAQVHPLPRSTFDVVISRFGIMFFGDPAAAFANIAAALRAGGRAALLCAAEPEGNQWLTALATLADLLPLDGFGTRPRHVLPCPARRGGRPAEAGGVSERTHRTRHGLGRLGTHRGRGRRLPAELRTRPPPPHADHPRYRHPRPGPPDRRPSPPRRRRRPATPQHGWLLTASTPDA
ncbi:class I SAM-dependent methyltransferase [Streptomyces sp. NPDC003667]